MTCMKVNLGVFPMERPSNAQVSIRKNYGGRQIEKSKEKERVHYFGRVFSEVDKWSIVNVSPN